MVLRKMSLAKMVKMVKNGQNGQNGKNGKNGENGQNGKNGKNGQKMAKMAKNGIFQSLHSISRLFFQSLGAILTKSFSCLKISWSVCQS
jgi:hypothetical protein